MSSCCTPDGSCSTGTSQTTTAVADSRTTVYAVSGMSCGHCKATLTKAIGELDGVLSVDVDVAAGQVTVTTGGAPDDALLAKVVDEAGYELTGRVS
ncbi:MAG TPA: heavy-metal-associated domain-containing protein [Streptomyces sp.]|uniref:heavy-metal-associated domain-containing protein n=1 Tax=Streptomyces sp. TaxID=1931 RepID=UPI002D46CE2D|nr:heavy-metal-associated domain-containing protein [Streptomyces sp.]HZG02586.1 heavy-metal-associated domain-containing protein [Streptomyces sp.]